jgi:hypothetical protein
LLMNKFAFVLRTLLFGWLVALRNLVPLFLQWLKRECRHDEGPGRLAKASPYVCVPIDEPAFVKPDPLIYAQYFLASLGLAVTWDNPDIELRLNGIPVPSSQLKPGTTYDVVARIWNASPFAPVVQMPVSFSYLDFGIGTVRVPIASTKIDLGVIGGPNDPAFATVPWKTPDTPGHYCLLVELDPFDDMNFFNNLGQENVQVGAPHSPAVFQFPLRNDTKRRHVYRLEADAYIIPDRDPCDDRERTDEMRRAQLARHQRGAHPIPAGWQVKIVPDSATLAPNQSIPIEVTVTPPSGFKGTQPINVNAFHDEGLAGGVTLTVVVS